jgi:hypothetical protein
MNEEQPSIVEDSQEFQQFFNKEKSKPTVSYLGQLGILIGLLGVGVIIGSLIAGIAFAAITHTNLLNLEKAMSNPVYANAAKVAQLIGSIVTFFAPAFFYALIVNKKPFQHLGFTKKISAAQTIIVAGIALAGLFLSGALAHLNEMIPISHKAAAYFKQLEDKYS